MSVLISIILFLTLIVCSVFSESCFESDSGRIENCKEELVTIKPITQLKRISEKSKLCKIKYCKDYYYFN